MIEVVIVNWNSGNYLENCVNSIIKSNANRLVKKIIIVDNNSSDCSLDFISNHLEQTVIAIDVVRNKSNIGFSAACNIGFKSVISDYVLFLNPDCIINSDALSQSFNFINEHDDVGVVGIRQYSEDGITSRSCARFPTVVGMCLDAIGLTKLKNLKQLSHHMAEWDHESSAYVDHVIGSFYLVKSNLFKSLNGFDERFFVYLEDLDFSFRVAKSGKRIFYLASSSICHVGGGCSRKVKEFRTYLALKSKVIYCKKHFSRINYLIVVCVFFTLEPFARLLNSARIDGISGVRNTLGAYRRLLLDLTDNIVK